MSNLQERKLALNIRPRRQVTSLPLTENTSFS
jgi:hypothetical protein